MQHTVGGESIFPEIDSLVVGLKSEKQTRNPFPCDQGGIVDENFYTLRVPIEPVTDSETLAAYDQAAIDVGYPYFIIMWDSEHRLLKAFCNLLPFRQLFSEIDIDDFDIRIEDLRKAFAKVDIQGDSEKIDTLGVQLDVCVRSLNKAYLRGAISESLLRTSLEDGSREALFHNHFSWFGGELDFFQEEVVPTDEALIGDISLSEEKVEVLKRESEKLRAEKRLLEARGIDVESYRKLIGWAENASVAYKYLVSNGLIMWCKANEISIDSEETEVDPLELLNMYLKAEVKVYERWCQLMEERGLYHSYMVTRSIR